jgi:predicted dehydrogenase
MSTKLKVAIVGCGQISDGHVSEIQKLDNATVVAVCDLEPIMAEQLAVRFGVPHHYSNFQQLLTKEKPDVVHICTPPSSHLPLAKQAIAAGCHIYVEKPLTMNYPDAVEMVETAEKAGRKITIGHTYEYDPPAEDLRRLLAEGVLGEVVHIESWLGYNLEGPFGKVILGSPDHWVHGLPGKLFHNNLNHVLNKITEFIDDDQPQVQAMAWTDRDRKFGDVRDELLDELRVTIRGKKVSAYATFTAKARPIMHFQRVFGTKNSVHMDFVSRTVALEQGATLPSAIGRLVAGFSQSLEFAKTTTHNLGRFARSEYHFFAGVNRLIRLFYDSILYDKPLPIPTKNILKIAWIMDEIFAQVRGERRDEDSGNGVERVSRISGGEAASPMR